MSYRIDESWLITCPKCGVRGLPSARTDIDGMCTGCANKMPYTKPPLIIPQSRLARIYSLFREIFT